MSISGERGCLSSSPSGPEVGGEPSRALGHKKACREIARKDEPRANELALRAGFHEATGVISGGGSACHLTLLAFLSSLV